MVRRLRPKQRPCKSREFEQWFLNTSVVRFNFCHHVAPNICNEGACAVGVVLRHLLVFPTIVIEIEFDLHVKETTIFSRRIVKIHTVYSQIT